MFRAGGVEKSQEYRARRAHHISVGSGKVDGSADILSANRFAGRVPTLPGGVADASRWA